LFCGKKFFLKFSKTDFHALQSFRKVPMKLRCANDSKEKIVG